MSICVCVHEKSRYILYMYIIHTYVKYAFNAYTWNTYMKHTLHVYSIHMCQIYLICTCGCMHEYMHSMHKFYTYTCKTYAQYVYINMY